MKRLSHALIFFAIIFLSYQEDSRALAANSASDTVQVNLGVDGCDNNGFCEAMIGETLLTCPNDCTPTPPNTGGGYSSVQFLYNISVEPGLDFAIIRFKTWAPVFATVRWGKTAEVTSGVINNPSYLMDHVFYLPNLESSTTYFFSIEYQNNIGNAVAGHLGVFRTLDPPVEPVILNPTNLRTKLDARGIPLWWNNPVFDDFAYVRVMRNTDHFYASPFAGKLIYEGLGEYVLDQDVEIGKKYYYTFFSRTYGGEFSSGVGLTAVFGQNEIVNQGEVLPIPLPGEAMPHFTLMQGGAVISTLGGIDTVDGTISIHVESEINVFPPFQNLWLGLDDPSGHTNYYLLIYNEDKKIYQADIPALRVEGKYEIKIYRFLVDRTVLLDSGVLRVVTTSHPSTNESTPSIKSLESLFFRPIFWIWLLILLLLLWLRKKIYSEV